MRNEYSIVSSTDETVQGGAVLLPTLTPACPPNKAKKPRFVRQAETIKGITAYNRPLENAMRVAVEAQRIAKALDIGTHITVVRSSLTNSMIYVRPAPCTPWDQRSALRSAIRGLGSGLELQVSL